MASEKVYMCIILKLIVLFLLPEEDPEKDFSTIAKQA